ncbi:MAG: hypothetical protein D6763_06670 [Alphaproteobacteria bacterium]|nr:MAG: hypothetical protein D6763_06670 [Alphaproteobacteria bacterium]
MTVTDEKLSAYLDGMLEPEDAARTAQALLSDPSLRARFNAMKVADKAAATVFGEIDKRPVPEALRNLLDREGNSARRQESRSETQRNGLSFAVFRERLKVPRNFAALAASIALAIGFGAGITLDRGQIAPPDRFLTAQGVGVIEPGNPMFELLQNAPSGQTLVGKEPGGAKATVVLTFKTKDGRYCREVEMQGTVEGLRTLFCKQEDQWRMVASIAVPGGTAHGYTPATTENLQVIENVISRLIDGAPLSRASETDAIKNGWDTQKFVDELKGHHR